MAKKVATHTSDVGGLQAPRNSLEIPIETSYGIYSGRDNILYAYHVNKESSEKNCCSTEAPIKKLISEEISKGSKTRISAPSVVARLMGVDMLPFDSNPAPQLVEVKTETPAGMLKRSKKGSNSSGLDTDKYSDKSSSQIKSSKPKPREHPQEEELQKFKKEFEAWQAARFKECSKVIEFDCAPSQFIAQEDLLREKMFLYVKSKRATTREKLMEPKDLAVATASDEMSASHNLEKKSEYFPHEAKESFSSNRISTTDYKASRVMNYEPDNSVPTKIVILRPGPDRMGISENSWNSTPSSSAERGNIKDFLEEVKERLKSELQGKGSNRTTTIRGGGIETPYREKPTEPRQIAQRIAQQVRDSVTRDFGMNLLRSESTRSYRNEIHLNGSGSPEFINKDTRRFLTEKLRNVLKCETHGEVSNNCSGLLLPDYKNRVGHSRDTHIEGNMDSPERNSFGLEKQSRLRRLDFVEGDMSNKELSPRNLIRSLSAPVSGTSFGKLLLEDRHMLTGAQIRRKHEVVKKVSVNPKKQKKDRFNIRERVSSFRYSLTLRGRLFHRRYQSMEGSQLNKHDLSRDISSGPTIMKSFYTHENSTEVPPSPASICSSVHEDFWRSEDYSSPTSSSGIYQMEDYEMPNDFREISSNLNELRRKLNQLEGAVPAEIILDQQPHEVELEIQDQAEAYIRDLLVASGLYHGSCNVSMSKWDPLGKPISNQIFEEVEESYRQIAKDNEMCKEDQGENLNHKLLLELLNETLPAILKPPTNMPRYMKAIGSSVNKPMYGRKLLFRVWETIKFYVRPPADRFNYDLGNMLTRDLKLGPLFGLIDDDINTLGRDLECQIIGDLLEEIVNEFRMRT